MENSAYYILLCIASTILFVYALWKKKDNKLIVLYFFIAGLTYFLEYFVLVLFKGYAYYPNILKNEYFDNIMGAIVSDAFTIPMTSTVVAAFNFNSKKRFLLAAVIIVIEILFIRSKIYEHYWWNYYYTFLGAIIVYYYSQIWLSTLRKKISRLTRYITLFFVNLVIQSSIVFILAGIMNLYLYNIQWFDDPYRSHIAFATVYIIFITIIFISIIVFRLKWFLVCIGILLPSIIDIILLKMNILNLSDRWSIMSFLIFRILIFVCISLFNKYLLTEAKES